MPGRFEFSNELKDRLIQVIMYKGANPKLLVSRYALPHVNTLLNWLLFSLTCCIRIVTHRVLGRKMQISLYAQAIAIVHTGKPAQINRIQLRESITEIAKAKGEIGIISFDFV